MKALVVLTMLLSLWGTASAQETASRHEITIRGIILDGKGKPVAGASVQLDRVDVPGKSETSSDADGTFSFSVPQAGKYRLSAHNSTLQSSFFTISSPGAGDTARFELVLEKARSSSGEPASQPPMEFVDKPNFTIAGVTDWTAVGGHGSDTSLRTSEDLARETRSLKPESAEAAGGAASSDTSEAQLRAALANAPGDFEANHQLGEFYLHASRYRESVSLFEAADRIRPGDYNNELDLAQACEEIGDLKHARELITGLLLHRNNADLNRVAAEIDEKTGDSLAAVREFEKAVQLDPSEQNYFEWGSELLFHRAIWQAQEVFRKGFEAYPKSVRMLTALGTALFAGARYDQAALRLCAASDLEPTDMQPYIFMGKVEIAAPDPLSCIDSKLERFVNDQPESSLANYLYAMSLLKQQRQSPNPQAEKQAEALLEKAIALDPRDSDAYLQLGILSASRRDFQKAIAFYMKAIQANPASVESYYRLGVAYDRMGESAKAREEFQLHDQIEKQQTDAVEKQRRDIKQFLVVQSQEPIRPTAQ